MDEKCLAGTQMYPVAQTLFEMEIMSYKDVRSSISFYYMHETTVKNDDRKKSSLKCAITLEYKCRWKML